MNRLRPLVPVLMSLLACSALHNKAVSQPLALVTQQDTTCVLRPSFTLADALAKALLENPGLRAFAWEVRAREAHALQAGLRPNPEFGAELEDFAGTGPLSRFSAAELTLGLSQRIELGGDRASRKRVASFQHKLAKWDYEAARLDVLTETAQAFIRVLAAQQRRTLADSLLAQAEHFYQSVLARVKAGKVSALEERRAEAERATTEIAFERASGELSIARSQLAANWGRSDPDFDEVVGQLVQVETIPGFDRINAFIERNPEVARWQDEMAMRRADLSLAHARRIPDPVLTIGTRHYRELDERALAAGISIPLPIFDRNQGAIQEARYRIRQGEAKQEAMWVRAEQMLVTAYERLAAAHTEVEMLRDRVVPAAQEHFTATEEGYREGKFDLLAVLDAQRTLFEITNQYIDALTLYHITRSEVERLIGTPLSDI